MSRRAVPVVTVDGPSGTGKGTLCQRLAEIMGWHLLDSGALYRVLALVALRQGIDARHGAALAERVRGLNLDFGKSTTEGDPIIVFLDGEDVTAEIRTEECGRVASQVARHPQVREALLTRQRAFRQPPGLVADGRDMGTVVFPDAELKIFLTASPEQRARRRYNQLKQKGISVNLPQLSMDIEERDIRDSQRSVSPLKPAEDAVIIDTSDIGVEAVVECVKALIEERRLLDR